MWLYRNDYEEAHLYQVLEIPTVNYPKLVIHCLLKEQNLEVSRKMPDDMNIKYLRHPKVHHIKIKKRVALL